MKPISLFDVADLNKLLEAEGYSYRIRLHDACGKSVCQIQSLKPDLDRKDASSENPSDQHGLKDVQEFVREFLEDRSCRIVFEKKEGFIFWSE